MYVQCLNVDGLHDDERQDTGSPHEELLMAWCSKSQPKQAIIAGQILLIFIDLIFMSMG